jgi:hypothetical protein
MTTDDTTNNGVLLCDQCKQPTNARDMVIMLLIDVMRTVCQDCAVIMRNDSWVDVLPDVLPLGDDTDVIE